MAEHSAERYREYYQRNKKKVNAKTKNWYWSNLERSHEYHNNRKHLQPERWLFNIAKSRAKKKGIEFTISIEDIIIPKLCPILEIELKPGEGTVCKTSPTLDRVNSTKGYIPGNVRVISHEANRLKSYMTKEILERLIKYVSDAH